MIFADRAEAGRRLAAELRARDLRGAVVLGIPRGGVVVAAEIARALRGELGVVVARKLGAPGQAELAIGAVTSDGAAYVNERVAALTGADERYLAREIARQAEEARRRETRFDGARRPVVPGRTVIVVDDGVATGATAIAALRSMRAQRAARVVLAVPVGPPETLETMREEADLVVCLHEDPEFFAVGQFYLDFAQLGDEDVATILDAEAGRGRAA